MTLLRAKIEAEVAHPRWFPYFGFHDEHRGNERTAAYRPAVQQVRSEFYDLLDALYPLRGGYALQLGMGEVDCSHEMWRHVFAGVVSIDRRLCRSNDSHGWGLDTHHPNAIKYAERYAPYNFLFIDAGHSFANVKQDYLDYSPLVANGGMIAFHDALPRDGYPEVEVHKFLKTCSDVRMIGSEVGTAWLIKS